MRVPSAAGSVAARRHVIENWLLLACALAWLAGLIHVQAALDHFDEYAPYAVSFIVLAVAQGVWGVAFCRYPGRRLALCGAVGSLVVVGVWLCSRVVGLPFGPDTAGPEPVGLLDVVATLDEIVIAALVLSRFGWRWRDRSGARGRIGTWWVDGDGARFLFLAALAMLVVSTYTLSGGYHAH